MAGRILDRMKRRLPCTIRLDSRQFTGIVLDVSASGMFIQTGTKVNPGDTLDIEIAVPGTDEPIQMAVEVVRQKRVPAQLRAVAKAGVGVRVINAPEGYYRFMQSLGGDDSAESHTPVDGRVAARPKVVRPPPDPAPPASTQHAWEVWVKQQSGPRSKRLFVDADDEASAREAALKQLGEGWLVLEVSDVPT